MDLNSLVKGLESRSPLGPSVVQNASTRMLLCVERSMVLVELDCSPFLHINKNKVSITIFLNLISCSFFMILTFFDDMCDNPKIFVL